MARWAVAVAAATAVVAVACSPAQTGSAADGTASSAADGGDRVAGVNSQADVKRDAAPADHSNRVAEARSLRPDTDRLTFAEIPAASGDHSPLASDRAIDPTGGLSLSNYLQLLRRDAIKPIYEPLFVSAEEANLPPDELVMGVSIDGDARAYPVGTLRIREIVNDVVGGVPVIVTW